MPWRCEGRADTVTDDCNAALSIATILAPISVSIGQLPVIFILAPNMELHKVVHASVLW